MGRAKRISATKYYLGWAKAGFPKRKGKAKAYVVKKKKKKKKKRR